MNFWQTYLLLGLVAYFVGCLQWSYLIVYAKTKKDIRTMGSHNAGASNTVLMFGWKLGALVGLLDILKATIFVAFLRHSSLLGAFSPDQVRILLLHTGLMVLIGHIFPFYMQFKGGKGTASALGLMAVFDWRMALVGLGLLIIVTLVTNYIALGALAMWAGFISSAWMYTYSSPILGALISFFLLALWLHRINLIRIHQGTESGLRKAIARDKG